MEQHVYRHHSQSIFEEGKIIWELEQIIETSTEQLRIKLLLTTSLSGRT